MKQKLLVIGIDGGTLDVILPMIKNHKLPTFKKLIKNGSWGKLLSTVPPVTAPAWTSFITGTNPGKHGVFYFFNNEADNKKSVVSFNSIKTKPFWRNLNENEIKVGLVNIPITYPPDQVDGFIISGMLVPPKATDYVYPHSIFSKLDGYKVDLDGLMAQNEWRAGTLAKENGDKFLKNVFNLTKSRAENTLKLMKEEPWDFFMVVFTGSDRICHFFWEDHSGKKNFSHLVEAYYILLDSVIARLINEAGEDSIKLLMSDHGFGAAPKRILNLYELSKQLELDLTNFHFWKRYLKDRVFAKLLKTPKLDTTELLEKDKNIIHFYPIYANFFGISINKKIEKNSKNFAFIKIKKKITEKLKRLKDPITGKKIVQRIMPRESVYTGPFAEQAPDFIVQLDYDYIIKFHPIRKKLIYDIENRAKTGEHRLEGLFIASGPNIESKKLRRDIFIQDVTPTILYLMNSSIPNRYDGRLIDEMFSPDHLQKNHPIYEDDDFSIKVLQEGSTSDEFEESKRLLENLGYM
jgi:predicted AlkP superfamily phosphohydrolase/phosphomutase